jgi:hypothetical protein
MHDGRDGRRDQHRGTRYPSEGPRLREDRGSGASRREASRQGELPPPPLPPPPPGHHRHDRNDRRDGRDRSRDRWVQLNRRAGGDIAGRSLLKACNAPTRGHRAERGRDRDHPVQEGSTPPKVRDLSMGLLARWAEYIVERWGLTSCPMPRAARPCWRLLDRDAAHAGQGHAGARVRRPGGQELGRARRFGRPFLMFNDDGLARRRGGSRKPPAPPPAHTHTHTHAHATAHTHTPPCSTLPRSRCVEWSWSCVDCSREVMLG